MILSQNGFQMKIRKSSSDPTMSDNFLASAAEIKNPRLFFLAQTYVAVMCSLKM